MKVKRMMIVVSSIILASQGSCERACMDEVPPFVAPKYDYVLAIVLDTSGSFARNMQSGRARAYRFFMRATDDFFRDRMGSDDRIVIAQLSAEQKTLLWEGQPLSLKRRFPDSEAFRSFLMENSNPSGSRVYSATADTLNYVMDMAGIVDGHTQVLVLVLSDMESNLEDLVDSRERVRSALKRFSRFKGGIGFYWVSQTRVPEWRGYGKEAGIQNFVVESEIVEEPELPRYEQR